MTRRLRISTLAALALAAAGCTLDRADVSRAMPAYPRGLPTVIADVHVFRNDARLTIVNSTARDYEDVVVWVNARYARRLPTLPAGDTVTLSLWDFFDARGEVINAGGFFRTYAPQPVRLVELQVEPDSEESAMVGLVTIRAEKAPVALAASDRGAFHARRYVRKLNAWRWRSSAS